MPNNDFDSRMADDIERNSASDYARALDDAAAIEAKERLNRSRLIGFIVGAGVGLVLTSVVLKALGR